MPHAAASIVDQVASLTDQLAIAWHGRLVGQVDAASVGVWAPGARPMDAAARTAARSVRGALMAGRIRQADVDEVKARTNIADIIGERVALKSAGVGSLKGLCPFHDERSPSFNVRPQAGFYHCFGCGESGDVYSFLRAMDHVTLHRGGRAPRRPHRLLAALRGRRRRPRAHRPCAPVRRERRGGGVLPRAARRRRRPTSHGASSGERGFDAGAAAHFGVGYAPKGWSGMHSALRAQGYSDEELSSAGLVSQGQRGVYDRFRGRVVWPIRDVTGQVIGFGARRLYDDDNGPKYLNTPETTIYKKAQVLYGLDLAKREVSRQHRVVVVEGYTDVMACHLAGITTAIATCGTAFGSDHITVLRRVMGDDSTAGEVVFTFDPDAAGQKAALRAFADAKRFNAQTYVATGPEGLDPCDLRLARGDGAVRALLETEGAHGRVRDRSAHLGLRSRQRRGPCRRAARRPPRSSPSCATRSCSPSTCGCSRVDSAWTPRTCAARSNARAVAAATGAIRPRNLTGGAGADDGALRVTLATPSAHPEVGLERDALMGVLQFGHRMDAEPHRTGARAAVPQSCARRGARRPSARHPACSGRAGRRMPSPPCASRIGRSPQSCSPATSRR